MNREIYLTENDQFKVVFRGGVVRIMIETTADWGDRVERPATRDEARLFASSINALINASYF